MPTLGYCLLVLFLFLYDPSASLLILLINELHRSLPSFVLLLSFEQLHLRSCRLQLHRFIIGLLLGLPQKTITLQSFGLSSLQQLLRSIIELFSFKTTGGLDFGQFTFGLDRIFLIYFLVTIQIELEVVEYVEVVPKIVVCPGLAGGEGFVHKCGLHPTNTLLQYVKLNQIIVITSPSSLHNVKSGTFITSHVQSFQLSMKTPIFQFQQLFLSMLSIYKRVCTTIRFPFSFWIVLFQSSWILCFSPSNLLTLFGLYRMQLNTFEYQYQHSPFIPSLIRRTIFPFSANRVQNFVKPRITNSYTTLHKSDLLQHKHTVFKVIKNRFDLSPHTLPKTLTKFDLGQLFQPIYSSIIHCFSYIKTTIKSAMIGPSKDDHYLPCFMLHSAYLQLRMLAKQQFWFYKECFMAKKLGTFTRLLFIVPSRLRLQDMAITLGYRVPDLGSSLVDVVDGSEIKILFVPTKEGLPGTNITVRFCNSLHFFRKGILQQRIQSVEVPCFSILVHQSTSQIGTIYRRRVCDGFPELGSNNAYQFLFLACCFVLNCFTLPLGVLAIILQCHFVLDHVFTLEEASTALNILFYGIFNYQIVQFQLIVGRLRNPSRWRYDLCE